MFPLPFNFPFRKKDGSMTTIGDAISSGGGSYTLPTASANTKGGVKIGAGLTMDGETLKNTNPTPFTLPVASDETLGGVKVGSGLSINENGVLSASGGGGGSVHLFYVTTNTYALAKIMVLTNATSITDFASLRDAIGNGVVIVLDGTEPSNKGYVTTAYKDGNNIKAHYVAYRSDETRVYQSDLNITSISTVTATPIF